MLRTVRRVLRNLLKVTQWNKYMEIIAKTTNISQSPKKIRVIARKITDLSVDEALETLKHLPKRAAKPLYKTIRSAVANAEHNESLKKDDLEIKEIEVGQAFVRRAPEFRARGRLNWRRKRSSHIRVVLTTKSK